MGEREGRRWVDVMSLIEGVVSSEVGLIHRDHKSATNKEMMGSKQQLLVSN